MPLLTRIEKRLSKKDKEDKLGITDLKRKMKEMQEENGKADDANSDSDSSGSDDSDDSDDSDEDSDDDGGVPLSDEEDSSSDDDDDEQDDEELEDGAAAGSEAEDEDEPIPLESVLENPIYSLADEEEEPETALEAEAVKDGVEEADLKQGPMGCMLCPNRVLKNEKMVEVHLSSKPHKRSAARFAKKIEDPTFDRSQVMDPRDVSIQIEEEIRAGRNPSSLPQAKPDADKSRSKSTKSTVPIEEPESTAAKPKRQRAWKEAKKEAKRRRVEAKETGQPPRKQLEREEKSQKEAAPSGIAPKTGDKQREALTRVEKGSKRVTKKEGKKSRSSDASKSRS
ncbi:hypothetical protein QFC21_000261 [Naganishia friedmannii]|uniref:Uncharacterized protein n=1 Tax=Naganishia friedmannii TaxID=89922 RepID=A0ACC2WB02_9TREE|nr:hypothetical protein QFC21_000261 [Naganishia friedmannii]